MIKQYTIEKRLKNTDGWQTEYTSTCSFDEILPLYERYVEANKNNDWEFQLVNDHHVAVRTDRKIKV